MKDVLHIYCASFTHVEIYAGTQKFFRKKWNVEFIAIVSGKVTIRDDFIHLRGQFLKSINTDGVFTAYSLSPGANAVALKDVITSDGMVFIQSRTNGIYGYTETNGVAVKRQIRSGVGNGDLPSDKVLSMAVDQDGELWIGTDEGLAVIYSPENIFDGTGSRDARPILFEEDGVVQKLLGDNPVSAIHVDGGNQKWLGTRGAKTYKD